jgi:hypothetical protein
MKVIKSLAVVSAAIILGVTGVAGAVSYKSYKSNDRAYSLEKAVRLQTLTNMALNNENYELACKAQQEVTELVVRAGVIDVIEQADVVESQICSWAWMTSISASR